MDDLWTRAWKYYQKNGWQRSMKMLRRKWQGTAPVSRTLYLKEFASIGGSSAALEAIAPALGAESPPVLPSGHVAVIGDLNLPQCKKYRVVQKLETLECLGIGASYAFWGDIKRSLDMMQLASSVIFYRMQDNPDFRALLGEARRLGIPVGYDIDDPLFDREVYGSNPNLAFLAKHESDGLLAAAERYRAAIAACDFAVTSTPAMVELMGGVAKRVYLWRNGVDAETRHWAEVAARQPKQPHPGAVMLGYASGSRAHEADFRVAEAALARILERFPETALQVTGYLGLPDSLRRFAGRITAMPFASYGDYIAEMGKVDINLVPLVADRFNACKSAIRYLDAAVVGVPTIASRAGDFVNVVKDGETGLLAGSEEEWVAALARLIASPEQRSRMGEAARRAALSQYSASATGRTLAPGLIAHLRGHAGG